MEKYDLNKGLKDLKECIIHNKGRLHKLELEGLQLAVDILEENRQEFEEGQMQNCGPSGQIYEAVED